MTTKAELRTLGPIAALGVGAGVFYYRSLVEAHLARLIAAGLFRRVGDAHSVAADQPVGCHRRGGEAPRTVSDGHFWSSRSSAGCEA
jgi:hypothetical protein